MEENRPAARHVVRTLQDGMNVKEVYMLPEQDMMFFKKEEKGTRSGIIMTSQSKN